MSFLPPTGRWTATGTLAAAATVGYLSHPTIWLIGPFEWLSRILAAADQESTYDATNTDGDGGASWGILQFSADTFAAVMSGDRLSAWDSGLAAAASVSVAILSGGWWGLYIPIIGHAYQRYLWTHGSATAPSLSEALSTTTAEARSWSSYVGWRAMLMLIEIPVLAILFAGGLGSFIRRRHG